MILYQEGHKGPPLAPVELVQTRCLELDLDIDTAREIQAHQRINRLGVRIQNIDQALVRTNLQLFPGVTVDEW